jgi:hypothetical protein
MVIASSFSASGDDVLAIGISWSLVFGLCRKYYPFVAHDTATEKDKSQRPKVKDQKQ